MPRLVYLFTFFSAALFSCNQKPGATTECTENANGLKWKSFTKEIFEEAENHKKLVLLDIGANWCHWCHVMDDSTYADSAVQQVLNENFILAREDQDSRADLFSKYRDWGWPAIIVFNANGDELLKLKGYQHSKKFINSLNAIIANPVPSMPAAEAVALNDTASASSLSNMELISRFNSVIDHKAGAFKTFKKSLHKAALDFALDGSMENDSLKSWAFLSIEKSYQLLDPVWGGIYQYSTHNDWKTPHYEKILRVQAEYIQLYVQTGLKFNDQEAISNAEKIYNYCNRFLSDTLPLFDNSQDADYKKGTESSGYYALNEEERLKLGTPLVNQKQFLKENALMAVALSDLWIATAKPGYLYRAKQIVDFLLGSFSCLNGLYSREKDDTGLYSLEDNLAMLQALIRSHQISGDFHYIGKANDLGDAILANFKTDKGNLASGCGDLVVEPAILPASNYQAALILHHLGDILKNPSFTAAATDLLKTTYRTGFDSSEYMIPYILMSRKYMTEEAFHAVWITDIPETETELEFVRNVLRHSAENVIIDRVDLRNMTDEQKLLYGSTEPNTLFMCTSSFCSSPLRSIAELEAFFGTSAQKKSPVELNRTGLF